ncbi:L-type lectin-domain containing receptor kinase IX.1-like [Quercus robur]|uniref:L-type lectin-domain containing receptor kinase IX.1-like n=1 Tax=Quercus robur TaxID=38942 RepID=UPI00216139BB|nr:L-type lectin-domain containing receptor kinase IX.1-like [Quercus robur]
MAVYNLTIKHFRFPQLFILFSLFMITNFFSVLTPFTFTSALSFNFPSFDSSEPNISYEHAYANEDKFIQLTGSKLLTFYHGRATYFRPMHLWDKDSKNLTDFATHFSFVIDSLNQSSRADGMAFFLAPNGSKFSWITNGSDLGLYNPEQNSDENSFVAVEFDICSNTEFDPPGEHVGIDINSIISVANVSWLSNITILEGKSNEAWISYNSSSHNLSVVFTVFKDNVTVNQSLSYIVDLRKVLPEWVTFGFSAATGTYSAMHTIKSWDFFSSLEIDNNNTNAGHSLKLPPKKRNPSMLVVGFIAGGFILVGGLAMVLFALWKRNRRANEDDRALDEEFKRETGPRRFTYDELARATNDFNEKEKLGQGGFGGVYRGFLRDFNSIVAVKRVSEGSTQGIREYAAEVKIISQLRHKNLVQLIGWCHERSRGQLLLVYDFMHNGSLDSHLFKEDTLLVWEVRYRIVQHLALALLYLHEGWDRCVLHRDIKPSNIMLDSNFNAKLGDFGLARLVDHASASRTTDLAGTKGYMDPGCVTTRRASKESDIYSFGIVALELACGRKSVNHEAPEDQVVMLEWVRELHGREVLLNAADQRLGGHFDEQQMKCLLIVGLWCAHSEYDRRPSIKEAIQVLNFEAPLPHLQFDILKSSHHTPTMNDTNSTG